MNNILVLKDVCKTYHSGKTHQIKVLDGLNLAIKSGEVVGLLAPSGAGKSTLLHIAGLLDSPDSGQIFINGADYSTLSDRRRTQARRGDVGLSISFIIYCQSSRRWKMSCYRSWLWERGRGKRGSGRWIY